eukprot:CAMPEP_0172554216 /NCGR_PEP_ID=MMETSP1067-20121228/53692_1 /TAXON_ID=265564 ORGANISM="Thalassiosira punctigera, Strain Tpunct2005C2" /NCGR_SAMPLE_ID=MMETSP1067 /ASSEMBLY_ACC=CAM_ASM_000444 /LENGTH=143 /DNA_ID=CAMNT_0013342543 /DNA_START=188 /DNA_END=616 /DNA_ORIENTATION=-
MDFITLANAAHETSRTLLRLLTEDAAASEDDDFAHLENIGVRHSSSGAGATAGVGGDNYADNVAGYGAAQQGGGSSGLLQLNRPLLSPTSEAVLLELSTNFLLYVAMVVITAMVAKIYFPSWLEPREEPVSRLSHAYNMNLME